MRTHIGVIYPSDGLIDDELWAFAPSDVTLLVTRLDIPEGPITVDYVKSISEHRALQDEAAKFSITKPRAVCFACTSVSFARGVKGDEEIIQQMSRASGVKSTTTATAIVAAAQALRLRRVNILTPYVDSINRLFVEYLASFGIGTVSLRGLGLTSGIGNVSEDRVAKEVEDISAIEKAEGVIIACTNLRTAGVIEQMEEVIGTPVITANQATIWHALKLSGYQSKQPGLGQLYLL